MPELITQIRWLPGGAQGAPCDFACGQELLCITYDDDPWIPPSGWIDPSCPDGTTSSKMGFSIVLLTRDKYGIWMLEQERTVKWEEVAWYIRVQDLGVPSNPNVTVE